MTLIVQPSVLVMVLLVGAVAGAAGSWILARRIYKRH